MQRQRTYKRQRQAQRLGMDELMIVNPARGDIEAVFLDESGVLRAARPLLIGANEGTYRRTVSLAASSAGPCMRCGATRRLRIRNY